MMADFQFCMIVGLLVANLLATLLVQRMLHNHHEQACRERDEERDGALDED